MQITFNIIQSRLERANIPQESYSLDGYKEDALCVESEDGKWYIYEATRGRKGNLHSFVKEKDACNYFLLRARQLKIVTKEDGIPLPTLVKDLNLNDKTPRFIDAVNLKNGGAPHCYMSHEHKEYYDIDNALVVDAECVVRCENCKHKRSTIGKPYCVNENGLKKITNDTYCSYGEEI